MTEAVNPPVLSIWIWRSHPQRHRASQPRFDPNRLRHGIDIKSVKLQSPPAPIKPRPDPPIRQARSRFIHRSTLSSFSLLFSHRRKFPSSCLASRPKKKATRLGNQKRGPVSRPGAKQPSGCRTQRQGDAGGAGGRDAGCAPIVLA